MNYSDTASVPSFWRRVRSVWYRHERVYNTNFISNAFPPLLEPLILLWALGIGFGAYIQTMGSISYILFLASGIIVTSSMFTAAFECTYGTYFRLEYEHVYDGMLGAPVSPTDLVLGEILFAGTKGLIFSFVVLLVTWAAGVITYPLSILAVFVGFITGLMFGALSMWVTSMIQNINHFNFYLTGMITPMFYFSGAIFPIENLPRSMRVVAEVIPLTHTVRLARAFCVPGRLDPVLGWDLAYCVIFVLIAGGLALYGIRKRVID
ncbi:MAG: ABC transporter permease [Solirubrobacterales bacterium]